MKYGYFKVIITAVLLIFSVGCFGQTISKGSIGISFPVIWNNSKVTYFQTGKQKYSTGNAISYGLDIDYSRFIYKGFYGKLGIGYFYQCFNIVRPFRYYSPVQLLYSTSSYSYNTSNLLLGIGYLKTLKEHISIECVLTYNYYFSFRQKYIVQVPSTGSQINKDQFTLGNIFNLACGIKTEVSNKISLGMDLMIPIYTRWNKDEMFINNYYSNDEQQIAKNIFSIGIAFSCIYNL